MSSADVEQAEPADELREGLLAQLVEELGDSVVGSEIRQNDMWVRVHRDAWHRAAEVCRQRLGCDYFCFLSGLDWMPAPKTGGDAEAVATDAEAVATDEGEESETPADATPVEPVSGEGRFATGYAGGDTRFQVFARLYSTKGHYGITLKADLDDIPRVDSIADLYAGANWHEREAWEMYGFEFVGHPDLRHLYLPSEFEGFPLRKDFPLLSREVKPWPGLVDVEPMPQEEGDEAAAGDEEGEG